MNKYQEALNRLKLQENWQEGNECQTLQELIDKETPIKPIEEDGLLLCGICKNHTVAIEGYTGEEWCCYACGQVIDWTNDES
ncbi:hypothetical protein [Erysipelothrix anatis]|uniref:hypothetical protein n=1 Tax=Erysipelothrix anatis TaxID=2683713 RepID=UPI0013568ABC|nr:hypothetical protein [Erysipelothrix anatis]